MADMPGHESRHQGGAHVNRWRMAIWGGAACLLLVPAAAMRFTREVDWTASDFAFLAVLLATVCIAYELATWRSDNTAYHAGAGVALIAAFVGVWANLAVGMLGSERNPANLLFGGVLLVGLIGAVVARFRARGMARAMMATALAQAGMVVYALVAGYTEVAPYLAGFLVPWLLSAWWFRKAARETTA